MPNEQCDIAIVGAGAAGLMAGITAGRVAREANRPARIIALDGARTIGAKILVAGGGRCNVTHHAGGAEDFAGASRNAIAKVLRAFTFDDTARFFRSIGVELKREPTGKLFPTTDSARTVLSALLNESTRVGVEIRHPWRVDRVEPTDAGLRVVSTSGETINASRVILATGGRALPKSGSDGHGYTIARSLGHTITPRIFPALAPLRLDPERTTICELKGVATPARLEVRTGAGKRRYQTTGDTLITHFGLSGPAPMDASRHLTEARVGDPDAGLFINWRPDTSPDALDQALLNAGKRTAARLLAQRQPERLARWLCETAGVDPATPCATLTRSQRRSLVRTTSEWPAPVTGDRGFTYAEATAGGVPLTEVRLDSMQSRPCQSLHLCGEILDVDGRIGGFNFQWAWSSGFLAGNGVIAALKSNPGTSPPAQAP